MFEPKQSRAPENAPQVFEGPLRSTDGYFVAEAFTGRPAGSSALVNQKGNGFLSRAKAFFVIH